MAVLSLVGAAYAVFQLDPFEETANILLFYAASGTLVLSLTAWVLYFFRQRFRTREFVQRHFYVSVRQGFWVAIFFILGLFLQSRGLFSWLNSGFLLLALVFLESYFIYNDRKNPNN